MLLTYPRLSRKSEHPEKTHDFRQSVDWLFSHESLARIKPTNYLFYLFIYLFIYLRGERRFCTYKNFFGFISKRVNTFFNACMQRMIFSPFYSCIFHISYSFYRLDYQFQLTVELPVLGKCEDVSLGRRHLQEMFEGIDSEVKQF
jgi:hypothetical protein